MIFLSAKNQEKLKKEFIKRTTCAFFCSDGSGKKVEKHFKGCPYFAQQSSESTTGEKG